MTDEIAVTRGSGNVFADLGFANPEEELLKAQLVREIRDLLKRRRRHRPRPQSCLGSSSPTSRRWSTAAYTSSLWSGSCAVSAVSTAKLRLHPAAETGTRAADGGGGVASFGNLRSYPQHA